MADPRRVTTDFQFLWHAVRLSARGMDPYLFGPQQPGHALWPLWDRLFYPAPALLVAWPFTLGTVHAGQMGFVAAGAALLAWRLSKCSLWPLLVLATPSFAMAAFLGQWSPWLTLAALVPSAGFLLVCKPTLGLACFCYRPTRLAVASGTALVLVSLALMPAWPREWLDNLASVRRHPAPITTAGGSLLALAVLRWRTREGRLLLAMACVPQLLFFADQLPLALVARTRTELALLVIGGWTAAAFWLVSVPNHAATAATAEPYVLVGCYLPAMWIVLRRPNEGPIPSWLERRIVGWPDWLRGHSCTGATSNS